MSENGFAVGIDVGYSAVRIALFSEASEDQVSDVCLIENDLGSRSTPTVVAYDEQTRLIGVEAISHAALYPEDAVFNIKRLVGRSAEEVQHHLNRCFFDYSTVDGRLSIRLPNSGSQTHTIEYLLAFIFDKLKEYAENEGITVTAAVISVPHKFNRIQMQAFIDAANIVGINVLQVINDTISIAINYAWEKLESNYIKFLIIDFGASKLDVSLIEIEDFVIKDLTTVSHTDLGGVDFDERLIQLCITKISNEFDIAECKLETNGRFLHKLRIQCEKANISLNDKSVAHIKIDAPIENKDVNFTVSRREFEEATADLFERVMEAVRNVANTTDDNINDLIVVGGSSRLKRFENALKNEFNKKRLNRPMNVYEADVKGNTILAAKLSGLSDERIDNINLHETYGYFGMEDENEQMEVSDEYEFKTVESWKGLIID
ncbi:70 kDa heat shock protein-like protein [Leptotrombidium deliense]|uniref:70 kDa heat shock protein-like protein n=1 Tax=Leptotrombidium deliense TaxID=299467 RepID=A0A443S1J0_9ACAR|nr:70 kDa heat shock protein-like protein [Leptotrombidium deliense]